MDYFASAIERLAGVGFILCGAVAWAGIVYVDSMEAVISFAVGLFWIALGTAMQFIETDR